MGHRAVNITAQWGAAAHYIYGLLIHNRTLGYIVYLHKSMC